MTPARSTPQGEPPGSRCVGLMSGTSLDGVDAVLVAFSSHGACRLEAHLHQPFEPALVQALMALQSAGPDELHRASLAANAVARAYASVTLALLNQAGVAPAAIACLGAHGQTVRHQPLVVDGVGYTAQLLQGALLAELVGVDVVCDFRSADLAAGGQGAPLVPAFHAAMFGGDARQDRAVLNLGGMANVTLLSKDGGVRGFDTGPGGALLDGWCARHQGTAFDNRGAWAAQGTVHQGLLVRLLGHPFFALQPPKSTGRDAFHLAWLDAALSSFNQAIAPVDVQATLSALTAHTVANALLMHAPQSHHVVVCGGGARNDDLMRRLAAQLPGVVVQTSEVHGIAVDHVEAMAFAWLAHAHLQRLPGNLPAVTGAKRLRVLGAYHSAR